MRVTFFLGFFVAGVAFLLMPRTTDRPLPVHSPEATPTSHHNSSENAQALTTATAVQSGGNRAPATATPSGKTKKARRLTIEGVSDDEWKSAEWQRLLEEKFTIETELFYWPLLKKFGPDSYKTRKLVELLVQRKFAAGDLVAVFNESPDQNMKNFDDAADAVVRESDDEIKRLLGPDFDEYKAFTLRSGVENFVAQFTSQLQSTTSSPALQKYFTDTLASEYENSPAASLLSPFSPPASPHRAIDLLRQRAEIESKFLLSVRKDEKLDEKSTDLLRTKLFNQFHADLSMLNAKIGFYRATIPVN